MVKELSQYDWDDSTYSEPYRDPSLLEELYWNEDLSLKGVSNVIGCGSTTVKNWMEKRGIPRREPDNEKYPRPRTQSEYGSESGYEVVVHHHDGEKFRFFHHRLISVAEWGLDAISGCHVHHRNHLEWDNRIENLELRNPGDHARQHRLEEPNDEPWHDEELLREKYVDEEMTMEEIADDWECNSVTVHNWLHRYGIPTRNKAGEYE